MRRADDKGPRGSRTARSCFKYGMKRDFNAWLASLGDKAPVKTLTELRAWNTAHGSAMRSSTGRRQLDISDEMDLEKDDPRYEADRAKDIRLAATHGASTRC